MNDDDEILDLVNEADEVIGQIRRGDVRSLTPLGGKYTRSIDMFIVRSDGKIWVPVRSMHKSSFPGSLDFSVGGHVQSGDTYEETVVRELKEEAGMTAGLHELEFITDVTPTDYYKTRLFLLRTDTQPILSSEHTSGQWMTIDELQKNLEAGVAAKESMLPKLALLKNHLENK